MGTTDKVNDIVKFDFEGNDLLVIEYNGRKCWIAGQVATALGYKDAKRVSSNISGEWKDEFEPGIDYDVLKGAELADLKELLKGNLKTRSALFTSQLTVLYESGMNMICILTKAPSGRRLRKWLSREVLPTLRSTGAFSLKQFGVPKNFEEALLLAARQEKERKLLVSKIKGDKPKVQFANDVGATTKEIQIGDFAKILNNDGIKIGRNRLYEWLREKKYLMFDNKPYQKYVECGWFVLIEKIRETDNGPVPYCQTRITGKGQVNMALKLRQSGEFVEQK